MAFKSLTQAVLVMISAVIMVAGHLLNWKPVFESPTNILPWSLVASIGSFVFIGVVLWIWYDQRIHINKLEDTRPLIYAIPKYEGGKAWLEVHNRNLLYEADFTVNVENLRPTGNAPMSFDARWRQSARDTANCPIKAGGKAEADFLSLDSQDAAGMRTIQFWKAFETRQDKVPIGSEFHCDIKILTTPAAKVPFEKSYVLQEGDGGNWRSFQELPTPKFTASHHRWLKRKDR